jgi:hypothetical protein
VAFTCPRCQRTSHSPQDERQGYCAACGDFTGSGDVCECGLPQFVPSGPQPASEASAEAMARYAAQRFLSLASAMDEGAMAAAWSCEVPPGLILSAGDTVSFTVPGALITGSGGEESPNRQIEVDDCPWSDPMQWSPGDAEL